MDLTVQFRVQEQQSKTLSRELNVVSAELTCTRATVASLEKANKNMLVTVAILEESVTALKKLEIEDLKVVRPQQSAIELSGKLQVQDHVSTTEQLDLQVYSLEVMLQESTLKAHELNTTLRLQEKEIEDLRVCRVTEAEGLKASLTDMWHKINDLTAARILLEMDLLVPS